MGKVDTSNVVLMVRNHTCGSPAEFYNSTGDVFMDTQVIDQLRKSVCMWCLEAKTPGVIAKYPPLNGPRPGHGWMPPKE